MPRFLRGGYAPGVHASINTTTLGRPAPVEGSDAFFAVGYSIWGPVNQAVSVAGLTEFVNRFGGLSPNSRLAEAIYAFFEQGGSLAYVVRVVGAAAAVATLTLNDRAGAPVATLRVDAKYPSSVVDVRVTVEAGTEANTVKLKFRSVKLAVEETFDNVKLTFTQQELDAVNAGTSPLTTIQFVNDHSAVVKLTDLASATLAPNNLPAVLAETPLAGGSDDFAGVSAATFIGVDGAQKTGLQVFNSEGFGPGQVAIPGATTQAVHVALLAHADRFKRFALLDLPLGTDRDAAITARRLLSSPYGAIYWPHVRRKDFAGSGADKLYPPSGFVAGVFARAEAEVGVHQAPAGKVGRLLNVLDVERAANNAPQTEDEGSRRLLNDNEVNVITPLPEQGVKVYGARCLMSFGVVTAVHEQRVLNMVYYQLKRSFQDMPFAVIDGEGKVFREARSIGRQYLTLLWREGALYGADEEAAFTVICDAQNNPPASVEQNQLNAQVGVKISKMAEKVFIPIDAVPLGTSFESLR